MSFECGSQPAITFWFLSSAIASLFPCLHDSGHHLKASELMLFPPIWVCSLDRHWG